MSDESMPHTEKLARRILGLGWSRMVEPLPQLVGEAIRLIEEDRAAALASLREELARVTRERDEARRDLRHVTMDASDMDTAIGLLLTAFRGGPTVRSFTAAEAAALDRADAARLAFPNEPPCATRDVRVDHAESRAEAAELALARARGALREIAEPGCADRPIQAGPCLDLWPTDRSMWCDRCTARAALASPGTAAPAPCTGITATWCPVHGECKCPPADGDPHSLSDPGCPLHAPGSAHGEPAPAPDAPGTTGTPERHCLACLQPSAKPAPRGCTCPCHAPAAAQPEGTGTKEDDRG